MSFSPQMGRQQQRLATEIQRVEATNSPSNSSTTSSSSSSSSSDSDSDSSTDSTSPVLSDSSSSSDSSDSSAEDESPDNEVVGNNSESRRKTDRSDKQENEAGKEEKETDSMDSRPKAPAMNGTDSRSDVGVVDGKTHSSRLQGRKTKKGNGHPAKSRDPSKKGTSAKKEHHQRDDKDDDDVTSEHEQSESSEDELREVAAACRRALRERGRSNSSSIKAEASSLVVSADSTGSSSPLGRATTAVASSTPSSSAAITASAAAVAASAVEDEDDVKSASLSPLGSPEADIGADGTSESGDRTHRSASSRKKKKSDAGGSLSSRSSAASSASPSNRSDSSRRVQSRSNMRRTNSKSFRDLPGTAGSSTTRESSRSKIVRSHSALDRTDPLAEDAVLVSSPAAAAAADTPRSPPSLPRSLTPRSPRRTKAEAEWADPDQPNKWRITRADRNYWAALFDDLVGADGEAVVSRAKFRKSMSTEYVDPQVPNRVSDVFKLADTDGDGALSSSEFILARWLVRLTAAHDQIHLPATLPLRLVRSARIHKTGSHQGDAKESSGSVGLEVQILQDMVAPVTAGGLELTTVQFKSRPAKRCSSGSNVTTWLIGKGFANDRAAAQELGNMLVERRILTPLLKDKHAARAFAKSGTHDFRDDATPYQLFSSISQKSRKSVVRSIAPDASDREQIDREEPRSRIAVFGFRGTGKSSLIQHFHHKHFDPTLRAHASSAVAELGGAKIHRKKFQLGNGEIVVETLDVPEVAPERNTEDIFNKWIEWGDAFVLCYNVTSRESFNAVPELFTRIVGRRKFKLTPFVLVGLQVDERERLQDDEELGTGSECVTFEDGQLLAERYRCPFVEASAKGGIGTRDVFNLAIDALRSVEFAKSGAVERSGWIKLRTEGKGPQKRFMTVTNSGIRFFSDKPKSAVDTTHLKNIVRMDALQISLFQPYAGATDDKPRPVRPGTIGRRRIQLGTLRKKQVPVDRVRRMSDAESADTLPQRSASSTLARASTSTSISASFRRATRSANSSPSVSRRSLTATESTANPRESTQQQTSNSVSDTAVWLRDGGGTVFEIIFASHAEQEDWFHFISRCIERANLPRETEDQAARNVASSETTAETHSTLDESFEQSTPLDNTARKTARSRRASTLRNPRRSARDATSSDEDYTPEVERGRRTTVGEADAPISAASSPRLSRLGVSVSEVTATAMSAWDESDALTPQRINTLVREFNRKPFKAVIRMLELGLFGDGEPEDIAEFLANPVQLFSRLQLGSESNAVQIDRVKLTAVGEFLGGRESLCGKVRVEFAKLFDVDGQDFEEALRGYLEKFTLPREAQMIDRIVESFAAHYCEQNPGVFSNPDVGYILMFSIIMLNTDAHNDQVKTKMTLEEFVRNNRGIDGGKDVDRRLLERIYHNVTRNEIKMQFERADFDSWEKQGWIKVYSTKSKEGTLRGKGKQKHDPVPFWVIVSNNSLWLFTEPQGKDPLFIIPLFNLKISSYAGSERHEFCLLPNDSKTKIRGASRGEQVMLTDVHLHFEDRTTKYEWMLTLQHTVVASPTYGA